MSGKAIAAAILLPLALSLVTRRASASDLDIQELAQKVVSAREAIQAYELRLTEVTRFVSAAAQHRTNRITAWRTPAKHRVDHVVEAASPEVDKVIIGKRQVGCLNCDRDGYVLNLMDGVSGLTFAKQGHRAPGESLLVDYRMLGYIFSEGIDNQQHTIRDAIYSNRLKDYKVSYEDFDGVRCLLVKSVVVRSGVEQRLWVRPDQGYNIVRIEASGTRTDGTKWLYETRSQLVRDPGSNIWFPKRWTYTREVGGVKTIDNATEVEFARFNHTIPESVFTVAGINPPDGTPIGWPEITDRNKVPLWKNNRPDPKETVGSRMREFLDQAPPPPTPVNPPGPSRGWLIAAAALFGGLGVWLVVTRVRRSRAA